MNKIKIMWLGQAGLLFEKKDIKIIVDPYLSDSVEKINPKNHRLVKADNSFFDIRPSVMIFTHNHLDHFDPETAGEYLKRYKDMTVLCPMSVWEKAREYGNNNYVLLDRGTEWTEYGFKFTAVKAVHSDENAIGVVITDEETGENYYITGDTLYSEEIFGYLPKDIKVVFLPVNGVGTNMNMTDAARFAEKTKAEKVVPIHFGMFDEIDPEKFICRNKVIPKIYEEIKI